MDFDLGVVVPAPFLRLIPILDRMVWAPLHAGKAELTLVVPAWLFVLQGNVLCRTNAGTRTTTRAFFIGMELTGTLVRF